VAAALYGQREAVAALVEAGICVDSRAEKVRKGGAVECMGCMDRISDC
jgi:hypothetical protein